MNKKKETVVFIACMLLLSKLAYADVGIPMIFVTIPCMLVALIPVILLETFVISKKVSISFKHSLKVSSVTNSISTILGIPLTWIALVLIQMVTGGGRAYGLDSFMQKFLAVTWQGPWLIPYHQGLHWMIPAASAFLLIPFFFASWFIEYMIAKRMLKGVESAIIKSGVFSANVLTYSILFFLSAGWLVFSIFQHPTK